MTEEYARQLEMGDMFPYDASDAWNSEADRTPLPADDWAHRAARGVLHDLTDRRGIKHEFYNVDEDIRVEMVQTLAGIIRQAATEAGLVQPHG